LAKIIFIRHGETIWNTEKRLQGHLNSPLTSKGETQASLIAKRLKKGHFTSLYSSDLGRALQTAEYISNACNKPIIIDKELREHDFGIFQGLTYKEMEDKYPIEWNKYNSSNGFNYIIPQGESLKQRSERAIKVLNKIAERHKKETIVIVSHGEILSDILTYILEITPNNTSKFNKRNAAYNVFNKVGSEWTLDVWGDTSHLDKQSNTK